MLRRTINSNVQIFPIHYQLRWSWYNLWSDEANFSIDGSVNKNNAIIWGTERPSPHQRPLHSTHVTVWTGLSREFKLKPFFFNSTVTSQSYKLMLLSHMIPQLQRMNQLPHVTFQHGAPPHFWSIVIGRYSRNRLETMALNEGFRIIGHQNRHHQLATRSNAARSLFWRHVNKNPSVQSRQLSHKIWCNCKNGSKAQLKKSTKMKSLVLWSICFIVVTWWKNVMVTFLSFCCKLFSTINLFLD